jgi:hypothetical protein
MLRASKSRVKATHLAKTIQKPKPKVRFSQAVASCRKLSQLAFFRKTHRTSPLGVSRFSRCDGKRGL